MPDAALLHEIRRWYAYADWANAHMLDACDTLDPAALTREMGTSFGSVLGTLQHLYGADWVWSERFLGRSPTAGPALDALTSVPALREAWGRLAAERSRMLDTIDPAQTAAPLAYRNLKGEAFAWPLGDLLFHVSNHATYHRGQVMQMVRQLGGTARSTDFVLWLAAAR
ncbi:MAG TPA: DinB family protein [Gemmatimonadaceae bacterium]|jgi:uncharacterized damage-inducible protein DinB